MKVGDQIKYVTTGQFHGVVVGITGDMAEITIDSAGWLAKPNQIVPLAQVMTPAPEVGDWVSYTVKHTITASLAIVHSETVEVIPDFCDSMLLLIPVDQIVNKNAGRVAGA